MFRRLFGQPIQGPTEFDPQVQESHVPDSQVHEEADVPQPFTTKEVTSDLPDPSAEDAASIVNDLALKDISRSSPQPSTTGKRRRLKAVVVDGSPKKRIVNKEENTVNGNERSTASTNGRSRYQEGRNCAEAVQVIPAKLSRPKKGLSKRHMANIYPVQKSTSIYDVSVSPQQQAEDEDPPAPVATKKPSGPEMTPRRRGRPRRVGPSPTQEATLNRKDQRANVQDIKVKPGRKGRTQGHSIPEAKPQEGLHSQPGSPSHETVPNIHTKAYKSKPKDDHGERLRGSKSKRSAAVVAHRHKDIKNTNTHSTKIPVNEARSSAKPQKGVEVVDGDDGEEDEEEKGESEVEASRGSEEVIDKDRQTSIYVGEEEGAEVEEEDSDIQSSIQINESEGEELELFGQDTAWKTVLQSARSICGSHLPHNKMPKLFTEVISALILDVKKTRDLYDRLLPVEASEHEVHGELDIQLNDGLDIVEHRIRILSEKTVAEKGSEVIRDIYARAIPAMVFLLQSALSSRVYHADEPCDLETLKKTVDGLGEIVRLQKMAIVLCEKASHWKAKPIQTRRPVVRPTTWKILPGLRDMNKAFHRILMEQDRKRRSKQNAVDTRKRQEELAEASRQTNQEAARKSEFLHRKIRESREQEDQKRRSGKRTFNQVKEDETRAKMGSRQINNHVETRTTWSDAEDLALYFQLEKGYAGHLTTAERYLNILNTPLLQNKLPEHIRERALYFRPTLIEERGTLEWITSIE